MEMYWFNNKINQFQLTVVNSEAKVLLIVWRDYLLYFNTFTIPLLTPLKVCRNFFNLKEKLKIKFTNTLFTYTIPLPPVVAQNEFLDDDFW